MLSVLPSKPLSVSLERTTSMHTPQVCILGRILVIVTCCFRKSQLLESFHELSTSFTFFRGRKKNFTKKECNPSGKKLYESPINGVVHKLFLVLLEFPCGRDSQRATQIFGASCISSFVKNWLHLVSKQLSFTSSVSHRFCWTFFIPSTPPKNTISRV